MEQTTLNAIKARLLNVGEFDWEIDDEHLQEDSAIVDIIALNAGTRSHAYKVADEVAMDDAEFIANSLQDVKLLVQEVERMQSSLHVIRMGEFEIEFFKGPNSIHVNLIQSGKIVKSKAIQPLSVSRGCHVIRMNEYEIELFDHVNSLDITAVKDGKILESKNITDSLTVEKLLNFLQYK